MGKDWYWSGRRRSSNNSKRTEAAETDIPSGCMCAVFQAFDFHPFHLSINQQHQQSSFNSSSPIQSLPKGAEAPRNSLESEDGALSSISKQDSFKIPNNIRIKTKGGSFSDLSNDLCSPGTKTPTLVARLMGLDLLPDANSPPSSSSSSFSTPKRQSHYQNRPKQDIKIMKHRHSTDSVIKTPTLSSEKTSYVEHRLSLQINKENRNLGEDLETPRSSFSKRKFFDENNCRSPSHYARQIVKQVKESMSRKVGIDITNTVKNREQEKVKEDFVAQIKFKKALKPSMKPLDESNQGKVPSTNTSHSPRLSRFNDNNHKHSPTTTPRDQNTHQVLKQSSPPPAVNIEAQVSRVSTKPQTQAMSEKEDIKSFPKCNKTAHGNLSPRINRNKPPRKSSSIRNKQEESFITTRTNDIKTNSKRTHPISNNHVPNLLHLKTHPSPSATKIHQKQVNDDVQEAKNMSQLFSSSCHKYTLATRGTTNDESKSNGSAAATATGAENEGSEYQYITTILSRFGIHRATVTNLQHFQWFSSTHPLDPSIFHRLELYPTAKDSNFTQKNQVGPRCNRRLLFDLVDEVLSEILVRPKCYHGFLLDTVWKRVGSFPRAKCEVLEDIDGLIEMKEVMDKVKEEEEGGEKLVAEIEGKVLDMLVNETLTVMVGGT